MAEQILLNGSFEPAWRRNARNDADRLKGDACINRRTFLGGLGLALAAEYIAMRRAVAFPLLHSGSGGSSITNARTGTVYQYLPNALYDMQTGDEILLPAGSTYQYRGQTYYYANYLNTNCGRFRGVSGTGFRSMYLGLNTGPTSVYGGFLPSCDYGSITAVGSANNGRALLTPAYGILAQDFLTTDTEMYFDPSTPVANFASPGSWIFVLGSYNFAQFVNINMSYRDIDITNNGLTGVSGSRAATIPAGTIITSYLFNQNKGFFVTCGRNPGWVFTNLEIAYTAWAGSNNVVSSIQQSSSLPGGPYVGSMTLNNCFIHDCKQGAGLGYAGIGPMPPFAHLFDTELSRMGAYASSSSATHNIYIGHIGEFLMDNCYSHDTCGTWLVKSRANLNILTNNQMRGERTDENTRETENSGCDFSNGGLTYLIGNIHQQSLNAANQMINYNAEGASGSATNDAGAPNPMQEIYVINATMVGPANGRGYSTGAGAGKAPIKLNNIGVSNPEMPMLSQSSSGSLAARGYWVQVSSIGTGGGETSASPVNAPIGSSTVNEFLAIGRNNVLAVASPFDRTGAAGWNCYVNYADPPIHLRGSVGPVLSQEGNHFFWDSGFTQPIFSTSPGGNTISVTGTLTNGSTSATGLNGLSGIASIAQLRGLSVYVGGVATGLSVSSVNRSSASLTLSGKFSGTSGPATITFGMFLHCGFTYATALGDSVNAALTTYSGFNFGPYYQHAEPWYDGSYATNSGQFMNSATIQVPPGQVLTVNAPPSGPSWASGLNFWATVVRYYSYLQFGADGFLEGTFPGLSKLNASPISFGGSWTSPATVLTKGQQHVASVSGVLPNMFLQNAAPIAFGSGFTEPSTGLVNNNPTAGRLQWKRRAAINSGGGTFDLWYAVVPPGGLTSYSDTVYFNKSNGTFSGSVSVIKGAIGFDDNFPFPAIQGYPGGNSISIATAAAHSMVLAGFRSAGTAGAGFTQISTGTLMNAAYAAFTSAQSSLSITETGGSSSDLFFIDALAGSGAAPTLVSSINLSGTGAVANFTITSANAGDYLVLMIGQNNLSNVAAVGQIAAPPLSAAVGASPVCVVQNCIGVNFKSSYTAGSMAISSAGAAVPSANLTETTNLACNPFIGTTFGTPSFGTVFADGDQSHYDYRLAPGSPALHAASDPGTSPEGHDLVPHYQSSWCGLPTPGTPIAAKTSRSDVGAGKTGAIGALS